MILKPKNESEIELWTGIEHKIPLCCIFFFESVWRTSIKKQIAEYIKNMHTLTDNEGIILCPECLIKNIRSKKH